MRPSQTIFPSFSFVFMSVDMGRVKIVVSTRSYASLNDIVSDVFGRANTFTISLYSQPQLL